MQQIGILVVYIYERVIPMPNGPRPLIDNACYHITVRGNNRQGIFKVNKDYEKYLEYVKRCKRKYKFRVFGYCLMPNHAHLVIEVDKAKKVSRVMSSLQRSYTGYFNNSYNRVGHLWQGRFKSKIVIKDRYLINAINYIEFNPVRAKLVNAPHEYTWSSCKARTLGGYDPILDELDIA